MVIIINFSFLFRGQSSRNVSFQGGVCAVCIQCRNHIRTFVYYKSHLFGGDYPVKKDSGDLHKLWQTQPRQTTHCSNLSKKIEAHIIPEISLTSPGQRGV